MNANELADLMDSRSVEGSQAREVSAMLRQQQAEIEALKVIVERFIADWSDGFKNYEYNSDEPEENKLRDDVFAILRKAFDK
ncbi:hypothetical protein [Polynucleobacter asymbioticus]|jgi:hypothetical protein|uniref:Uncharacterized protein n=1 Tax=Polynucleobacter asymbioticus TaxID=576611 RepID=A0AAC9NIS6_9BURK|nr:hypothetical protein [Polynucleobacter asymbioticus]APB99062.1 hypothetical protein A4F89_06825 [Polynucleobacter asymbioticus]APC01362.1 hypothetical protein AOC25_06910 [Polynucleobacter asymbioticus]